MLQYPLRKGVDCVVELWLGARRPSGAGAGAGGVTHASIRHSFGLDVDGLMMKRVGAVAMMADVDHRHRRRAPTPQSLVPA